MKRSHPLILVALFALSIQMGCATTGTSLGWRDSAKKTVIASAKVYDLSMHVAGSSGLNAERQAEVVRIANIYRAAASAALAAADSGDQASYDVHVAEFSKAITDLIALLQRSH